MLMNTHTHTKNTLKNHMISIDNNLFVKKNHHRD